MKFIGESFETVDELKNLIEAKRISITRSVLHNGHNIYQYCCGHGTPKMLEYLDSLGEIDVNNTFCKKGWNCYLTAVYWGKVEQVHNININFVTRLGSNAYILAALKGHLNVLQYLDSVHGFDRKYENNCGKTAFIMQKEKATMWLLII